MPGRPYTTTIDGNIEPVKEMILDNRRISIQKVTDDFGITDGIRLILSNFYGCFRHEMCGNKECFKIAKF